MIEKLSVLEKRILADVLRHLMQEREREASSQGRMGRLAMVSPEFFAGLVGSITQKLGLPCTEFVPASEPEEERGCWHE